MAIEIVVGPIFGIGAVAILGMIFVRVQHMIPFSTIVRKAVFSAFAVNSISLIGYTGYFSSARAVFLTFLQLMVTDYAVYLVVDSLIAGLLFGYLLTNR